MISALHFKPEDGWFGDPMPLFADGIYHIYYTKLRDGGGLCWGQLITENLIDFEVCPDPFAAAERRGPVNTGCVFRHDGIYHAYYANFVEGRGSDAMLHAVSPDGIGFEVLEGAALQNNGIYYRINDAWRDPFVFEDKDTGLFHLIFCARKPEADPDCFAGVIAHAVSADLYQWELLNPLSVEGIAYTHECPQIIRTDEGWELIYYSHETRFRHSDSIEGPWKRSKTISPDHFDFMAAREMYDGKRHFLVGWLPRRDCDCAKRMWGGHMCAIRELEFDGGNPSTRFIREISGAFPVRDQSADPGRAELQAGWKEITGGYFAHCPSRGAIMRFDSFPADYYLKMKLRLSGEYPTLMLLIGTNYAGEPGGDCLDIGYSLMIDSAESLIRLRKHYLWDQRNDIAVIPFDYTDSAELDTELIIHGGIIEFSAGNGHTLTSRLLKYTPGGFAISMQDGDAEITGLSLYTTNTAKGE